MYRYGCRRRQEWHEEDLLGEAGIELGFFFFLENATPARSFVRLSVLFKGGGENRVLTQ